MLQYTTILDINENMTKDDFVGLVLEWNKSSKHECNRVKDVPIDKTIRNKRFGDDNLWLDIQEYRNENIIAVRHEKIDQDRRVWNSDFVMNFNEMKLAICLDKSYLEDKFKIGDFSTPKFVTFLVNAGYLKDDGALPVTRVPIIVKDDEEYLAGHESNTVSLKILADIINGKVKYKLPVVYVSKIDEDNYAVDVDELASRLRGVAHVLVQESITQNTKLAELCQEKDNERFVGRYEDFGQIGIYYFDEKRPHRKFVYSKMYESVEDSENRRMVELRRNHRFNRIVNEVIQYGNNLYLPPLYTWTGVISAIFSDRYISQKGKRFAEEMARKSAENKLFEIETEKKTVEDENRQIKDSLDEERKKAYEDAEAEANSLLKDFDDEIKEYKKKISELTQENYKLQVEINGLYNKLSNKEGIPILYAGNEEEVYAGEFKDLILSVLSDSLGSLENAKRRKDVVCDVIEANDYQETGKKKLKS